MKKLLLILTILVSFSITGIILYLFLIAPKNNSKIPTLAPACANQGESFSTVPEYYVENNGINYPPRCCEGLNDVSSPNSLCINNQSYTLNIETGLPPIGVCSNCGNGVCEEVENACVCPTDCFNKQMDFASINEFCDREDGYRYYCTDRNGYPLDNPPSLCNMCTK